MVMPYKTAYSLASLFPIATAATEWQCRASRQAKLGETSAVNRCHCRRSENDSVRCHDILTSSSTTASYKYYYHYCYSRKGFGSQMVVFASVAVATDAITTPRQFLRSVAMLCRSLRSIAARFISPSRPRVPSFHRSSPWRSSKSHSSYGECR